MRAQSALRRPKRSVGLALDALYELFIGYLARIECAKADTGRLCALLADLFSADVLRVARSTRSYAIFLYVASDYTWLFLLDAVVGETAGVRGRRVRHVERTVVARDIRWCTNASTGVGGGV